MSFESELTQFSNLFRKHLSDNQQAQIRWVTASEVDATKYTMTAVGLTDGLEYYNIMLGFAKMSVIPAVGSLCLIGLVEGAEAHTFLIHTETPDQVIVFCKNSNEKDESTYKGSHLTVSSSDGTSITSSSNITIASDSNISISSEDGKISIKNKDKNLLTILNGLIDSISGLTTADGKTLLPKSSDAIAAYKTELSSLLI